MHSLSYAVVPLLFCLICKQSILGAKVDSALCAGQFLCKSLGDESNVGIVVQDCVNAEFLCDRENNCGNFADELCCAHDQFFCLNGRCLNATARCNCQDDCGDLSDEQNCSTLERRCSSIGAELSCDHGKNFRCRSGECIWLPQKCDGVQHCADYSDEAACASKACSGYICASNSECVPQSARCDGIENCSDLSDEHGCNATDAQVLFYCNFDLFFAPTCGLVFEDAWSNANWRLFREISSPRDYDHTYGINLGYSLAAQFLQSETGFWSLKLNFPVQEGPLCLTFWYYFLRTNSQILIYSNANFKLNLASVVWASALNTSLHNWHQAQILFPLSEKTMLTIEARRLQEKIELDETFGPLLDDLTVYKDHCPPLYKSTQRCTYGQYVCGNGDCYAAESHCDGKVQCADGSDELNCNLTVSCENNQYACSGGKCIAGTHFCDGKNDCDDSSDEANSKCGFHCTNGNIIPEHQKCDENNDCGDQSDEVNCPCRETTDMMCNHTNICLDQSMRCDLVADCPFADDEIDCEPTPFTFVCKFNRRRIMDTQLCDGLPDCPDFEDELQSDCISKCNSSQWHTLCDNGYQCILKQYICDGIQHCQDASDEKPDCDPCSQDLHFKCSNQRCVLREAVCDRTNDCGDYSDELNCTCDLTTEFDCHFMGLNGPCSARESWTKYNALECPDTREYRCVKGLEKGQICDGFLDCENRLDETLCTICNMKTQFTCAGDKSCIPLYQVCNGISECADSSDENNCLLLSRDMAFVNEVDYDMSGYLHFNQNGSWSLACLANHSQIATEKLSNQFETICRTLGFGNVSTFKFLQPTQLSHGNGPKIGVVVSHDRLVVDSQENTAYFDNCLVWIECSPRCGNNLMSRYKRYFGGQDVSPYLWPSTVKLDTSHGECTGSLISDQWVLTGGHCLEARQTANLSSLNSNVRQRIPAKYENNIKVYVGGKTIYSGKYYEGLSSKIFMSPFFNNLRGCRRNDIALFKLNASVPFRRSVQPACLPSVNDSWQEGLVCTAVGWGVVYAQKSLTHAVRIPLESRRPQQANVTLRNATFCEQRAAQALLEQGSGSGCEYLGAFTRTLYPHNIVLCATAPGVNMCGGDSGGPLFCPDVSGIHKLAGVAATSTGNCVGGETPNDYVDIKRYVSWMHSVISIN